MFISLNSDINFKLKNELYRFNKWVRIYIPKCVGPTLDVKEFTVGIMKFG